MNVILLEKVRNLGGLGDRVDVKAGFARNYLIPQSKAVFATEKNIALFEQRRNELEQKAQQALAKAEQRATVLNTLSITLEAQASDEGKLYGSIGVSDIKDALIARSIEINKREIMLPAGPLYAIGVYPIEIHLHSDVVATIQVEIIAKK